MLNTYSDFSRVIAALVACLFVVGFLGPIGNKDIWWHLYAGQWMLDHQAYLNEEIATFANHGAHWPNFSWLFQLIAASVYLLASEPGLLVLKGILLALVVWGLCRAIAVSWLTLILLLICLSAYFQLNGWYYYLRPHLFEAAFLTFSIVYFSRNSDFKDYWKLGILILLWSNSHASAVVGVPALLLHYIGGLKLWRSDFVEFKKRLIVAVMLGLLIFATPNGFNILGVVFSHSGGDLMYEYITEWEKTPLPHIYYVLIFMAVVVFVASKRISVAELFLIGVFLYLALGSKRFFFELGIVLIRPTVIGMQLLLQNAHRQYALGVTAVLLLSFVLMTFVARSDAYAFNRYASVDYPVRLDQLPHASVGMLGEIADSADREIRVWNAYGYGGYITWRGQGKVKIFIDGRTPTVHPEENLFLNIASYTEPVLLDHLADAHDADAILLPSYLKLVKPVDDSVWALVAFDRASTLYVKRELLASIVTGITPLDFDPFSKSAAALAENNSVRKSALENLLQIDERNALAWYHLGVLQAAIGSAVERESLDDAVSSLKKALFWDPNYGIAAIKLAQIEQLLGVSAHDISSSLAPLVDRPRHFRIVDDQYWVAAIFLEAGLPHKALKALSPKQSMSRQVLDKDMDVWLVRATAHAMMGNKERMQRALRIAENLIVLESDNAEERFQQVSASLRGSP